MTNKNIFVSNFSFSWHRLLQFILSLSKDTLVLLVRYSATHRFPSREGMQTHSPRFSNYSYSLRHFVLLCAFVSLWLINFAQQATWIWYPGDFEIDLANKMQNRRTERGTFFPVFWKMDNHYVLIDFHKLFDVPQSEEVNIYAEGEYNVKLDGKAFEGSPEKIIVPAGKHKINIKVFNQANVPAIFVKGKTIVSDSSWLVTFEDKEWIDETGKTSDISATNWLNTDSWNFNSPTNLPSAFKLPVIPQHPTKVERHKYSMLIDFGKETFGFLKLHGLTGDGRVTIYYGESKEEALSEKGAVTLDRLQISSAVKKDS